MNDRQVSDADVRRIEREEGAIAEVQYLVQGLMNERGLSRTRLADLLGTSKSRVSQLLGDNANPTLRTLVALFDVLGEEICISRSGNKHEAKAVACESEKVVQKWKAETEHVTQFSVDATQVDAVDWKDLLAMENTRWRVDPASNDNQGFCYDELTAFA